MVPRQLYYIDCLTNMAITNAQHLLYGLYRVMQSDGNRFGKEVVLKSVNFAASYEDSILDILDMKKYIYFQTFLNMTLNFKTRI